MTMFISGKAPVGPAVIADTPFLANARLSFSLTLAQQSILLMDGPPGTGKSTCASQLMRNAQDAGRSCLYIAVPERPTPTELLRSLNEVLSGTPGTGTKHDLENEVRAHLADFGGVIFVDEVQNLKRTGLQELRYLHDDRQTNFALVLSGWQAASVIAERPDLDSRVRYRVPFAPLAGDHLLPVLRALDPRLAATDPELLIRLDRDYAGGNLRNWNNFLAAAADLTPAEQHISAESARAILAVLDPSIGLEISC